MDNQESGLNQLPQTLQSGLISRKHSIMLRSLTRLTDFFASDGFVGLTLDDVKLRLDRFIELSIKINESHEQQMDSTTQDAI